MTARALVYVAGDRVRARGYLTVDADGQWLEFPQTVSIASMGQASARSEHALQVVGVDVDAVPTQYADNGTRPGVVTVTGTWDGQALHVAQQSPVLPEGMVDASVELPSWALPPCAAPAGGWPLASDGRPDQNLSYSVGDLTATGAAVAMVTFRPDRFRAVLVVAATDVERVEAVLGPQLPGRLCVVLSRWTRPQLDAVRNMLIDHRQAWTVDNISERYDQAAQPSISVDLVRVPHELAEWADTLPAGLLTLRPSVARAP